NTIISTIDFIIDPQDKKEMQQKHTNPQLCESSEDLVYTEPFNDYNNRNLVFAPNKEWVESEIYNDEVLKLEAAKLKNDFLTKGQALIHGDLHTGSVFVTKDSTKVIDPEFTFYGPIGYDLGNVIAHLVFAYANGKVYENEGFCDWVLTTLEEVVDLFTEKFSQKWDELVIDHMAKETGVKEWYIDTVLEDSSGVAGMELIRRIVGMAQVADIVSIENEQARKEAERFCLRIGKSCVINRANYRTGRDFVHLVQSNI